MSANAKSTATDQSCLVPGVIELFGEEARTFRKIVRGMEDVLDRRRFDQLDPGLLVKDILYRRNLSFLGERFMDNLVYVQLSGEDPNVVMLPEGTMRVYDFIARHGLEKAKVFYSSQFVRDEDPEEVQDGKTRNFWQIGYEIFNFPEFESSIEVIRTADRLVKSAGLDTAVVRIADKRLLKGLISQFSPEEQEIISKVIDKSDDSPVKFERLYVEQGGKDTAVSSEVSGFLRLINNTELTLRTLRDYAIGSEQYRQGLENLQRLYDELRGDIQIKVLPFMAKSWDACDKMMFDIRQPSVDLALAGGGNLTYTNYQPETPKSGAGVGVTRIHQLLKGKA